MKDRTQKLNKEPYKGTRDFYPKDKFIQNYIFSIMEKVAKSYGYEEYGASILEETELYKAKSGSEIVNEQTYSFIDRGGRDVTIRPEMTPTVARMVAKKRQELGFPLRWFSIPNLLRYEKPQRGRLREHWQLNIDIFGIDGIQADAEIISVASDIMITFKAKEDNFLIKINNRKLTSFFFKDYLQLDNETVNSLHTLIDKKNKISNEAFIEELRNLSSDKAESILSFLEVDNLYDLPSKLQECEGFKELEELFKLLKQKGINNHVFDPTLVRGFDYYTGIIFEVFDKNPLNKRSIFGGGRYNNLVSIFNVENITAVGFGMGDVGILNFLETYNLLPTYYPSTKLYICLLDTSYNDFANELASFLREHSINTSIDYTNRKLQNQIKTAEKQLTPFTLCIGEDEVKTRQFKLKNLNTYTEEIVNWDELPEVLSKI